MAHRLTLTAVLGLVLGASGTAGAGPVFDLVVINDISDPSTVTINGEPVTLLPGSTGEFLHFHVTLSAPFEFQSTSASIDMLEPNEAFSDRLFVSVATGSTFLDVFFGSDPATTPIGFRVLQPVVETGAVQSLLTFNNFPAGDTVLFSAASDLVAVVPEPSTMVMAASGVAFGLAYWRRRPRPTGA
jgi:hypothetical protein